MKHFLLSTLLLITLVNSVFSSDEVGLNGQLSCSAKINGTLIPLVYDFELNQLIVVKDGIEVSVTGFSSDGVLMAYVWAEAIEKDINMQTIIRVPAQSEISSLVAIFKFGEAGKGSVFCKENI